MTAEDMARESGLPPRLAYTVAETAEYTGMTQWAIRQALRDGSLPFLMPRGRSRGCRIRPGDVDEWLDSLESREWGSD